MKKYNKGGKMPCQYGGKCMEQGGYTPPNPPGMYWDGKKFVKSKGATYSNDNFYQQGGPITAIGKRTPYWTTLGYMEDDGNIAELQMGGYIPQPINAPTHILKQTNGTYHMRQGGAYMNNVYSTQPPLPIRKMGGYGPMQAPGYWHTYGLMEDDGHIAEAMYGGQYGGYADSDQDADMMKKGGNWIKGAVNPAHKGYCTPMTKSTCTPRRKAFAMTMKKHHGFHKEMGGFHNPYTPLYAVGGAFQGMNPEDETAVPDYAPGTATGSNTNMAASTGVAQYPQQQQAAWRQGMSDEQAQANINAGGTMNPDGSYGQQQPQGPTGRQKMGMYAQGFGNLLGAGLMTAANFANRKSEKNMAAYNRSLGMSSNIPAYQSQGSRGDYNQQGMFRPNQYGYSAPGMFRPGGMRYGGPTQYEHGGEYELDDKEIARLKKMGYRIEHL